MKVFRNLDEIACFLGVSCWKVEESFRSQGFRGLMVIDAFEEQCDFVFHVSPGKMLFVNFDSYDNDDCKKYFLEFEKDIYDWKVYVDSIEGWQPCKVIDVSNTRLEINRATVVTEAGTQLNRICKYALDKDELKTDGCIYFLDKN